MMAVWFCVYVFKLSAQVCAKYMCEENVIPKPFFLGLFIGQGLGFKVTYLGFWSYTCRGLIPYTCPGVSVRIVFWNVLLITCLYRPVVDRHVLSLSCQSAPM